MKFVIFLYFSDWASVVLVNSKFRFVQFFSHSQSITGMVSVSSFGNEHCRILSGSSTRGFYRNFSDNFHFVFLINLDIFLLSMKFVCLSSFPYPVDLL